jgi:hypothetical protein
MVIVNPRRTREMSMMSYGRGLDEAAMLFTAPERDAGTKYLRKADEMWMYLPAVERVQKISGHMLRQGMMGSDLSYEDMTGSTDWDVDYSGVVAGQETYEGRPHWRIELTARRPDVTYAKRVTLVDAATGIPTRQELYAVSGMLVKTWTMSDVRPLSDGRQYPYRMRIEDKLREGTYTEIITESLEIGVGLPEEVFDVRWLERR